MGRPSDLSEEEYEQFVEVLNESPEDAGLDVPAWTVPLVQKYLIDEFDVKYCQRHVRRLMSETGPFSRTARPEYDKADERAQEACQDGFKKKRDRLDDDYTVVEINQMRQTLSNLICE